MTFALMTANTHNCKESLFACLESVFVFYKRGACALGALGTLHS